VAGSTAPGSSRSHSPGGALVYATGGFAYGEIHNSQADNRPIVFTVDRTATGFSVGGGIEYKLARAWSVKAEYQFIDLGRNDPVSSVQGAFTSFRTKLEDDAYNTFRVGVNYHFLPSYYAPLK
jgi:outer membrane immunogenic protein